MDNVVDEERDDTKKLVCVFANVEDFCRLFSSQWSLWLVTAMDKIDWYVLGWEWWCQCGWCKEACVCLQALKTYLKTYFKFFYMSMIGIKLWWWQCVISWVWCSQVPQPTCYWHSWQLGNLTRYDEDRDDAKKHVCVDKRWRLGHFLPPFLPTQLPLSKPSKRNYWGQQQWLLCLK